VEIVYVDDFAYGIWERFTTIYKVYMQIWLLFTISVAYFIYIINKKNFKKISLVIVFFLIFLSYLYPILTMKSKFMGKYITLNGIKYSQNLSRGDYTAVNWLNINIKGMPVILTKYGDAYTDDSFVSAFTGLPAVVGWVGHERVLRGEMPEIYQRISDIDNIYKGNNFTELIKKYKIEYIYIGRLEKEKYPDNDFKHFENIGEVVYSNEDVKIYKVNINEE
jgi:uncharacterized membrane protein